MQRAKISKQKKLSSTQNVATKRLMKDYKQIEMEPLPGVAAAPIEKNLFIWHANIRGPEGTPWDRGIFHMVLSFPQSYPNDPPTITLCTRMEHPNVIGNSICLDMLEKRDSVGDVEEYQGWSSAYTVQSILIQLQAFLFEAEVGKILANINNPQEYEKKKKEWLSGVNWSVEQSLQYTDKQVGHFPPRSPWPPFKDTTQVPQLTPEKLIEDEYRCYYTRQTYKEDCLGFGLSYSKNMRTGEIKSVQSPLDFVSLRAFVNHELRLGSANERFTHWLPVYINKEHGQKAVYLAKRAMSIICTGSSKTEFKPEFVMTLFPKLMSTQVVEVMSSRKHASIKALRGYCLFHRMFLEFVETYPEIKKQCNTIVENFCQEQYRNKEVIPNLGEFLAILSVSDYSWDKVKDDYLQESFIRSVYWLLAKYPELEDMDSKDFNDQDRLKYSFEITKTSQKLLLFHQFFLDQVAKKQGESAKNIMKSYDDNLGRPTQQVEDLFLQRCEKINALQSYLEFFRELNKDISEQEIVNMLKESVIKSKQKGYHGSTLSILSPEEFAKENRDLNLDRMLLPDGTLETNEDKWKELCVKRWGFTTLPDYLSLAVNPWRKLYLQHNLQDLLSGLNDAPDMVNFHKVLELSKEIPRVEIYMFTPTNIKSKYYFITLIIKKIEKMECLIIRKGESVLDVKGFKALAKGLGGKGSNNLNTLILDHCGITAKCIEELTTTENLVGAKLQKLVLNGNALYDDGAIHLSKFLTQHSNLPHLTELDLSDCKITKSGAEAIAEALLVKRQLKSLKLINNNLNSGLENIIRNLSYSTSIQEIDCSRVTGTFGPNNQSGSLYKLFKLSPSIKKINLWKVTSVSSAGEVAWKELANNYSLEEIDLGETLFNNLSILFGNLKTNYALTNINLMKNNINSTHIADMLDLLKKTNSACNVKKLVLDGNILQTYVGGKKKHMNSVGQWIQLCHNLTFLDLNNCGLSEAHITSIGEALDPDLHKIPLKTLLMRSNKLSRTSIKPLTNALKKNSTLEHLDISGNDLGVLGANLVAGMLLENKALLQLNLFGNFIEIEGAIMISEALCSNTTLQILDLGLNRIRVRGALEVAKMLLVNNTLVRLNLKSNHITDKAGMSIANNVVSNAQSSKLSYIALAGNFLSVLIRSELSLMFNKCQALKDRNFEFDLAKFVEFKDPERLEKTVYITPLPMNVTEQQLKKLFYSNKCGVCLNVNIFKHKEKAVFAKGCYAFVEFAHPDSVQAAMRLSSNGLNRITGKEVRITRAGIQNIDDAEKKKEAGKARDNVHRGFRSERGGRGGFNQPRRGRR
ncbi:hypothetical protein AKO1_010097 [Acrasis kona]|uniref:UBC core domain-containing protein n=1 Tax=Acrasis kona TaxID=1008807 RepID=A0AAW2ZRB5_9EUKA